MTIPKIVVKIVCKNPKTNIFVSTISKMLPGTEGSGGIPQENPWKNLVCAIDRPSPFA
jgi:hypothetical protein